MTAHKLEKAQLRKKELEAQIRELFRKERALDKELAKGGEPGALLKLSVARNKAEATRRNLSAELRKAKEVLGCH